MPTAHAALTADWLGASRRALAGLRAVLDAHPTTAERVVETGRGRGGDRTLVIDQGAEDAVLAQLERLHDQGHRFLAVLEERGEVDFGSDEVRVIVDPIDGSVNAKRGLPTTSLSIAVADGPTMADVAFAYVHDLGPDEEWVARRGEGASCNGVALDDLPAERRGRDGRLELLGIESADPRLVAEAAAGLAGAAYRLRALGSTAVTLCQVAAVRLDGMLTLKPTRAVDAAAGQLVVREAGGLVAFAGGEDPLGAPLDLAPHAQLVAARSPGALDMLLEVLP
jgi:myo-inositol-1(or 4)-monophosphatase